MMATVPRDPSHHTKHQEPEDGNRDGDEYSVANHASTQPPRGGAAPGGGRSQALR